MDSRTDRRSRAWLLTLVLLAPGCSVWQVGDVAPDYVDESTHRGAEVLAFDAASRTLASGGWEGKIATWNLDADKPARVWQAHDGFVLGVAFDGDRIVSGGQDGRLVLWTREGVARHDLDTGSGVWNLAVLNGHVITGHYDGSVRAWTLPGFDDMRHLAQHHGGPVTAIAVDPASGRVASAGNDGRVFLIEDLARARELQSPPTDAVSLGFVPGGGVLYGGGWVRVYRWNLESGGFETISTPHWGTIAGLQYLPASNVLASISRDNDSSVFFIDPLSGESVRHFHRQSICGGAISVSPDERYMATTGDDGMVRIWDLATRVD
jgi:WD40 repeat protein